MKGTGFPFGDGNMPTKAELEQNLKQAMKEGDAVRKRTLRMVLSAAKMKEVEQGEAISEEGLLKILQKEASSRQETIDEASQAGRDDLVQSTEVELEIIEGYLPKQLSEAEIREMAQKTIAETGATDPADMGKVMGPLMSQTAGRADGSLVSRIVREMLAEE
jgi:uncharacterized protein YqeY